MSQELPNGWRWDKIDNLATVAATRKKKKADSPNEPTSFIPMEGVNDVTGSVSRIIQRPYSELVQGYTYFENGDIIFAKITPCMQNGKCAIVEGLNGGFGFGSTEFIVLTPRKEVYGPWVHYFLRTAEFRKAAEENFTGSAGQQRVPAEFVKSYSIPVPNDDTLVQTLIEEMNTKQRAVFAALAKAKEQIEAIEALPSALLREMFAPKVLP